MKLLFSLRVQKTEEE